LSSHPSYPAHAQVQNIYRCPLEKHCCKPPNLHTGAKSVHYARAGRSARRLASPAASPAPHIESATPPLISLTDLARCSPQAAAAHASPADHAIQQGGPPPAASHITYAGDAAANLTHVRQRSPHYFEGCHLTHWASQNAQAWQPMAASPPPGQAGMRTPTEAGGQNGMTEVTKTQLKQN